MCVCIFELTRIGTFKAVTMVAAPRTHANIVFDRYYEIFTQRRSTNVKFRRCDLSKFDAVNLSPIQF